MHSKARCVVVFASLLIATGFAQRPQLVWSDLYHDASIVYDTDVSSTLLDEAGNLYLVNAPYQSVSFLRAGKLRRYTPKIIVEQYAPSGALNWRLEWRHPQAMSHNLIGSAFDAQGRLTLFVHVVRSVWRRNLNRLTCLKVDTNGQVFSVGEYPLPLSNASGIVQRGAQGDFFVAARPHHLEAPAFSYLFRISDAGHVLWRHTADILVETIGATPAGECAAAGVAYSTNRAVRLIGANGDLRWQTVTGRTEPSPTYLAVGAANNGAVYAVLRSGVVEIFSGQGTLLASNSDLIPMNYELADAAILPDGLLMLWHSRFSTQPVILMRTDLEPQPLWQRTDLGATRGGLLDTRARFSVGASGRITTLLIDSLFSRIVISHVSANGELNARYVTNLSVSLASILLFTQNSSGEIFVWLRAFTPPCLRIGATGELRFTLSPQHQQNAYDLVYALAVDQAGNTVLTRLSTNPNYIVYDLSHDSNGVRRWNEPGLRFGLFDRLGNWISIGSYIQQNTAPRILKRRPDGSILWNRTYSGVGSFYNAALASDDAFYITALGTNNDWLHKFSPDGSLLWTRNLGWSYQTLIPDRSGGVFVSTDVRRTSRFASDGTQLWTADAPLHYGGVVSGDILFTAALEAWTPLQAVWRLMRVNSDGSVGWLRDIETSSDTNLFFLGASDECIYAVYHNGQGRLRVLSLVPSTGAPLWERAFDWITDQPQTAIDNAGNLYLAFRRYDGESQAAYALKIAPSGELLWTMEYAPRADAPAQLMGLAVDAQNRLLLAGEVVAESGDADLFIAQFRQPLLGDANGDGCVDDADLLVVLLGFDEGDLNGDGVIDDADLLRVLFQFGAEC